MKTLVNTAIPAFLGLYSALFTLIDCAAEPRAWPDVLLIDDFEHGLDKWENQDAGKLVLVDDAPQGKKALCWTSRDDGIGHIVFKALSKKEIDFSQHDLLTFWVKFEGKRVWNLNPIIQQYPAVYGYRGLYYSIDTMEKFAEWFIDTQDLKRWENAWPDTFSPEKQEFQFEAAQLAGPGRTRVYLDHIRLLKNFLEVPRLCSGKWARTKDGSQVTHFHVPLRNRGKKTVREAARLVQGTLDQLKARIQVRRLVLLPGERGELFVRIEVPREVIPKVPAYYGETAKLAISVEETPGLVLFVELPTGTMPDKVTHPCVLMDPARMARLRSQWRRPELRAKLPRDYQIFVRNGEQDLAWLPEFPDLAASGRITCDVDGTQLQQINVPNLPFNTYQCPKCGRSFSGPLMTRGCRGGLESTCRMPAPQGTSPLLTR